MNYTVTTQPRATPRTREETRRPKSASPVDDLIHSWVRKHTRRIHALRWLASVDDAEVIASASAVAAKVALRVEEQRARAVAVDAEFPHRTPGSADAKAWMGVKLDVLKQLVDIHNRLNLILMMVPGMEPGPEEYS